MRRPFLVGNLVYLRVLEESDITEEYMGWLNDPEVNLFLETTGQFPATFDNMRQWLEKYRDGTANLAFAIVEKSTDRHIGNITLNNINLIHRTAWIGITIGRKDLQGHGYGKEAENLLIEHAFRHLQLHKIMHVAAADNVGGVKLPQSLGFKVEGTLRQQYYMGGKYRDGVVMGLLASEYGTPSVDASGERQRRETGVRG